MKFVLIDYTGKKKTLIINSDPLPCWPCSIKRRGILDQDQGLVRQKRKLGAMERFSNLQVQTWFLSSSQPLAIYYLCDPDDDILCSTVSLPVKGRAGPHWWYCDLLWESTRGCAGKRWAGLALDTHFRETSSALNCSTHKASQSDLIRRRVSIAKMKFKNHWAEWLLGPLPALMFFQREDKVQWGSSWSCGQSGVNWGLN